MNYELQCVAAVQSAWGEVKRCGRASASSDPNYLTLIPVCSWHHRKATSQFASRLEDELADLKQDVAEHECDGERAVLEHEIRRLHQNLARTKRWRASSQAYFIRCGGFIKIGASSSPAGRLDTIRKTGGVLAPHGLDLTASELVATERGGFGREKELHKKFTHLRAAGEWFTEAPDLTAYIESLALKESA